MLPSTPRIPIKAVGLRNFKAFGAYTEIEIGNLTVLSGLNSAGKSSIYQSLLLLVQSCDSYLIDIFDCKVPTLKLNGELVNLGAPTEILHDETCTTISFVLKFHDSAKVKMEYELQKAESELYDNKINFQFMISAYEFEKDGTIGLSLSRNGEAWDIYACESLSFSSFDMPNIIKKHILSRAPLGGESERFFWPFGRAVKFRNIRIVDFKNVVLSDLYVPIEQLEETLCDEYKGIIDYGALVVELEENQEPSRFFRLSNSNINHFQKYQFTTTSISYIPPFRGYPQRVYTDMTEPNPIGHYIRGREKTIPYLVDHDKEEVISGTVEEALHYWVVQHFKLAEGIEVEEPVPGLVSEIFLVIRGSKIPINNVGFGTSQIVPVIFKLLINSACVFIVDEPEIHLHASLQSKLATFFYNMMMIGKKIILETHSEYLIDKTIYHILLNDDVRDSVKMYWVMNPADDTEVKPIEFDSLGFLLRPPDGFLYEKKALVEELNRLRASKL